MPLIFRERRRYISRCLRRTGHFAIVAAIYFAAAAADSAAAAA